VLGIDPGTAQTGYALLEKKGRRVHILKYGCILTQKEKEFPYRLKEIHDAVESIIENFLPHCLAVENIYFYKNSKTAVSVSQARGVILCLAAKKGLCVHEYTPLQVKQAITGFGRATKKQIQQNITKRFHLPQPPTPDDAADALAVALCHIEYAD
jgi:crossover junction endodeoxyribonuclease RuvC